MRAKGLLLTSVLRADSRDGSPALEDRPTHARADRPREAVFIQEVLELLQVFLERLDGASTDEEYALKDRAEAAKAREASSADAVSRIRDAAGFVKERMATDLAVVAAQDRLELMDEMEGKQ